MTNLHKHSGATTSEWISLNVSAARYDPVGLWAIRQVAQESFGLSGHELRSFLIGAVSALLRAGADPILGNSELMTWTKQSDYEGEPANSAQKIVDEYEAAGPPPVPEGLWFGFPGTY